MSIYEEVFVTFLKYYSSWAIKCPDWFCWDKTAKYSSDNKIFITVVKTFMSSAETTSNIVETCFIFHKKEIRHPQTGLKRDFFQTSVSCIFVFWSELVNDALLLQITFNLSITISIKKNVSNVILNVCIFRCTYEFLELSKINVMFLR